MTPSKKWSCPPKIFSPIFSKNVAFFEKIVKWNNFKTSCSIRKVILIFVARHDFPSKATWVPEMVFRDFLRKYSLFSLFFPPRKLLNNKIFSTSFVINKVTLIFGTRRFHSLKKCQICSQNSFSQFSQKILFFSKKLLNKKIFRISNF